MPRLKLGLMIVILLLACTLTQKKTLPTSTPPLPNPLSVVTLTPLPVGNAINILETTCFDALLSLNGSRLIVEDATALNQVYDLLDNHCEEPMQRTPIDFSQQVLVIVAQVTRACDAQLIPQGLENQQLVLQFVPTGTCDYEVVALYVGTVPRSEGRVEVSVIGA